MAGQNQNSLTNPFLLQSRPSSEVSGISTTTSFRQTTPLLFGPTTPLSFRPTTTLSFRPTTPVSFRPTTTSLFGGTIPSSFGPTTTSSFASTTTTSLFGPVTPSSFGPTTSSSFGQFSSCMPTGPLFGAVGSGHSFGQPVSSHTSTAAAFGDFHPSSLFSSTLQPSRPPSFGGVGNVFSSTGSRSTLPTSTSISSSTNIFSSFPSATDNFSLSSSHPSSAVQRNTFLFSDVSSSNPPSLLFRPPSVVSGSNPPPPSLLFRPPSDVSSSNPPSLLFRPPSDVSGLNPPHPSFLFRPPSVVSGSNPPHSPSLLFRPPSVVLGSNSPPVLFRPPVVSGSNPPPPSLLFRPSSSVAPSFTFGRSFKNDVEIGFGKDDDISNSNKRALFDSKRRDNKQPDLMPSLPSYKETNRKRGEGEEAKKEGAALLFGRAVAENVLSGQRKSPATERLAFRRVLRKDDRLESTSKDGRDKHNEDFIDITGADVNLEPNRRRKRLSSSDVDQKTSIVIKNIPPLFNDQNALHRHFSQFGKVLRIIMSKQNTAFVYFDNHKTAARAKEDGQYFAGDAKDKPSLQIFWRQDSKGRTATRQTSVSSPDDKNETTKTKESSTTRLRSGVRSGTTTMTSELDDELRSMQGTIEIEDELTASQSKRSPFEAADITDARMQIRFRNATPPPSSVVSNVPPTSKISEEAAALKSLLGTTARTAGEKFAVLETRDKLLRAELGSRKQTDLASAKVTRGTCQDMCPEKERYMREDRNQLSAYEIIPGTDQPGKLPQVDNSRAIKEYSRSSADQDMPLPQELRPPDVLDTTMNYLLSQIVETGRTGTWEDWYDFLWNRTRSIRKDITQQHLGDPVAVGLVEKCARFHIFCSEALCEEDAAVFDQKINDENLTKCLQTLKEMYHDLHVRQNMSRLENEAEFCTYMVLMNLNKGDILREVQQLHADVRETQTIEFSVRVYSALNSNNYVKFFKLVRNSATFLSACVLHRYFNQIRTSALQRMIKAYAQPGHSATFALSELLLQLGFEDVNETELFCRHHGLTVVDGGHVVLDKNRFLDSEAFPARRSHSLVGIKRTTTLGEIINGGPLPACILKEPTDSFDEYGRFILVDNNLINVRQDADEAATIPIILPIATVPIATVPIATVHILGQREEGESVYAPPPSQPVVVSNDVVKELTRDLMLDVIHDVCRDVGQSVADAIRLLVNLSAGVADQLMTVTLDEMIRNVCQSVIVECRSEHDERLSRQRAIISIATEEFFKETLNDVVTEMTRTIATDEHRSITELVKRQTIERTTESITNELIRDLSLEFCRDFFQRGVVERRSILDDCERAVRILHLGRVFRRWKAQYTARQRLRKSMETFPPAPSMDSLKDQLMNLVPDSAGIVLDDSLHLGGSACITLKSPHEIFVERIQLSEDMLHEKAVKRWRHEESWSSFDLIRLLTDCGLLLRSNPTGGNDSVLGSKKFYWKMIVSLPFVENPSNEEKLMKKWMKTKFSSSDDENDDDEGQVNVLNLKVKQNENTVSYFSSVNICVISTAGDVRRANILDEKNHLVGTSAVLFVPSLHFSDTTNDCWTKDKTVLHNLLSSMPRTPRVPLAVICFFLSPSRLSYVVDRLALKNLVADGMIIDYEIVFMDEEALSSTSDELKSAISWMMSRCPRPIQMRRESVRDFVEDGLSRRFFGPVLENLKMRLQKGLRHLNPSFLINMYNDVIVWLASVASDDKLFELSWPVVEFCVQHEELPDSKWNSFDRLQLLRKTIVELTLPDFNFSSSSSDFDLRNEATTEDEASLTVDVWRYVRLIANYDNFFSSQFFSRIRLLVQTAEKEMKTLYHSALDECRLQSYMNFPWMDFVMICVEYRLDSCLSRDRMMDSELMVCYLPESVEHFHDLSIYLDVELKKTESDEMKFLDTAITSANRKRKSMKEEVFVPSFKKKLSSSSVVERPSENVYAVSRDSLDRLSSRLAEEKSESAAFEDYLARVLDLDSSPTNAISFLFRSPSSSLDERNSRQKRQHETETPTKIVGVGRLSLETELSNAKKKEERVDVATPLLPLVKCRRLSLGEKLNELSASLKSERTAGRLFEIRLENSLMLN